MSSKLKTQSLRIGNITMCRDVYLLVQLALIFITQSNMLAKRVLLALSIDGC